MFVIYKNNRVGLHFTECPSNAHAQVDAADMVHKKGSLVAELSENFTLVV